jgi:ATP/maltotriose-dependent transcriptional regulator MalT
LTDDPAAAYQEFEQAAELGVRAGDLDLIVLARLGSGQALIAQGDGRSGAVLLDEAMLAVTYDPVSPLAAGIVYCAVIIACRQIFDLRRAQEWTAALSQWCDDQQGLVPYRGQCLVHRSEILQIRGDWAAAWNEIEQACRHLADPPGDPVQGMALYQRGELLRLRGDVTGAEEAYRAAARWGHPMQPGLALLRLAQGRVDDASAAMRRTTADQQRPAERVSCLAAYAEIELAAHHPEAARTAVAELQRLAEHFGSTYLYALAERAAGGLLLTEGDPEAGSVRLRAAILAWRQLIAPYEVARTSVLLGDACALLGDHDTARIHRQAARETFEQLGALPDLHRLDGRLRAQTGELTERECEVLRMVATGRTNREVAAELVISEHTVRRHLQNIFGKLGIGSRSAATAYAHRHHLV